MAKINKIKKAGSTIYPVTVLEAVFNPDSGKTVKQELHDFIFGSKIDEDVVETGADGLVWSTNKWKSNFPCYLYDVSKARGGKLTYNGTGYLSTYNACAVIASYPETIVSDQTDVDYADGCARVSTQGIKVFTIDIPNDATYLWVDAKGANGRPPVVHITKEGDQGLAEKVGGCMEDVENIKETALTTESIVPSASIYDSQDEAPTNKIISAKGVVEVREAIMEDLDYIADATIGRSDVHFNEDMMVNYMYYNGVSKDNFKSLLIPLHRYKGKSLILYRKVTTYQEMHLLSNKKTYPTNSAYDNSIAKLTRTSYGGGIDIYIFQVPQDAEYLLCAIGTNTQGGYMMIDRIDIKETNPSLASRFNAFENYGKTIAIFGGSWAEYAGTRGVLDIWKKVLGTDKVDDYAMGGAGFGNQHQASGIKNIQEQVTELCADDAAPYDVYVLWASSNDFATPAIGERIGTRDWYTDADDYDESKLDSQCGGINYCIKMLSEKNPQAQIVFFSSCPIFNDRIGYDTTAKKQIKANDGSTIQGSFADYIQGQKDCCDRFHIPFLDQWNMLGINEYNKLAYFPSTDLRHMDAYGYTRLAYKQAAWLKNCIGQ